MKFRFNSVMGSKLGSDISDAGRIKCSSGSHLAHEPQASHPDLGRLAPMVSGCCDQPIYVAQQQLLKPKDKFFWNRCSLHLDVV